MIDFFFFFFSSRRRHTRLQGDWSSDVCSSDLSCGLIHTGGENHDRALVEDDLQFQAEITNQLDGRLLMRPPRGDDHPADGYPLGASFDELLPELVGRPMSKRPFFACGWAIQQGAVFRHNTVEKIDSRENFDQIVQFPPGNENEFAAGFTDLLEG